MELSFYTFKYALIKDGVVQTVIMVDSYPTAGQICMAQGCDEAVCVDQYLVSAGDTYANGVFMHEGNEIQRQQTLEEKCNSLQTALLASQDAINSLLGV